ncbi:MAG: alginate export family protein [Bacteroidota bacterium]
MLVTALALHAQFQVDGEFRSRAVLDHGYKVPVKADNDAHLSFDQRSRLILGYKKDILSVRFTLQDARVWGSDDMFNKTGVEGNSSALGIYEAWIDLQIGEHSGIRVGRQEWNYDDMRILSWRNWWTSGLSYDGILFRHYNPETGWHINTGISYNNNGTRTGMVDNSLWNQNNLKTMNFVNIRKDFSSKLYAVAMFTLSGKQDMTVDELVGTGTHGFSISYNKGKAANNGFFGYASGYYQYGKDVSLGTDENRKAISAHMINAEVGLRTLDKKVEVSMGVENISGRDYSNTDVDYNNTRHSFDLFYSARFPYYGGHLNYFLIQDSYKIGTKGGGYMNPFFKVRFQASKKDIFDFTLHNPMLTTHVAAHTGFDPDTKIPIAEIDADGNPVYWKGNLGNHIDLDYTRKISKEVIFKIGASYALISDIKNQMVYGYEDPAGQELNDLGQNYFVYTMLIVKPNFFRSE